MDAVTERRCRSRSSACTRRTTVARPTTVPLGGNSLSESRATSTEPLPGGSQKVLNGEAGSPRWWLRPRSKTLDG